MDKSNRILTSGWMVAALTIGFCAAGGFKAPEEKLGMIDLNKAIHDCELGKTYTKNLQTEFANRKGLMDFVGQNPVVTSEQAEQLKTLSIKQTPTDADKAKLESLKNDIKASTAKLNELSQKTTPLTDAEKALVSELSQRKQIVSTTMDRWNQEFDTDIKQLQQTYQDDTNAKARAALQEVGKAQGYTVIFEVAAAAYAANDLTAAVVKSMDAKK